MTKTFEVTSPDGEKLRVTGDRAPTEEELNQIFSEFDKEKRRRASPIESFGKQFIAGLGSVITGTAEMIDKGASAVTDPGGQIRGEPTIGERFTEQTGLPGTGEIQEAIDPGEPVTIAGSAGRFGGMTAGLTLPAGGAASLVSRAPATAGKVRSFGQNLIARLGEQTTKAPVATTASETARGSLAGGGGELAARSFPDTPGARFVGEILSGTLPALMPTSLIVRGGKALFEKAKRPFTGTGGEERGVRRIQELTDAEPTIEALNRPTTADPATGEAVLTPAQRSEDVGALSLQKAVTDSSNQLKRQSDEQIARANQVLQDTFVDLGASPVDATQEFLSGLLKTRLRVAAQRTDERIAELGKGASKEQANRIAKEEVEKSLQAARQQEKDLFQRIPQESPTPVGGGVNTLQRFRGELGQAQLEDIPAVARRELDPDSKQFIGNADGVSKIKDVRALQSKLRQVARNARASGPSQNLNKARIADDLADALTEDLANTQVGGSVAADLQKAVNFSREVNTSFKQGTVGKLLGRDALGADLVPESLALETTIAGGGAKSREAFDQIIGALDNPAIVERTGGSSAGFREAANDYVRHQFIQKAAPDGKLNVNRAQAFLQTNDELLKRLPDVRQELDEVIRSGQLTDAFRQRVTDPKVSKAALFIQKNPDTAYKEILQQTPSRAGRDMQNLVNMAKKDESGVALEGLKSGFVDFLLGGAKQSQRDVAGQQFVSGFALRDALDNRSTKAALSRLFNKGELKRLNTIVDDFVKLERARGVGEALEGIMEDVPGKFAQRIAGIVGAAFGRNLGRATGSGGTVQIPGQTANMAREIVQAGIKDPAVQFIKDTIFDETLFREVLQRGFKDGQLTEKGAMRLHTWMLGLLADRGADTSQEQETSQSSVPQSDNQQNVLQSLNTPD